jgi:DNA-directed RNA polymerase alpha subunit
MSVSTNEGISLGLAHEFIMALTKRGVTKPMLAVVVQNSSEADRVSAFIRGDIANIDRPSLQARLVKIEDLGLPTHAQKVLKHYALHVGFRIDTVEDLLQYTEQQLMTIPTMGRTSIRQIQETLTVNGFPTVKPL